MYKGILARIAGTLGLACLFVFQAPGLLAGTITWTIAEGTFLAGGASVEGSFQFDADALSNNYSDVSITVGNDANPLFSGPVSGDIYADANIVSESATELDLLDSGTGTELQLYFQNAGLTDAGGSENMGLHLLDNGNLADYEAGNRSYAASVSGTAPEPSTILMMLSGVLAVFAVKKVSWLNPSRQIAVTRHGRK